VTTADVTLSDRSTLSDGDATADEDLIVASNISKLNLTVGEGVTYTDDLVFSGTVSSLVFATDADSSAITVFNSSNDIVLGGAASAQIFLGTVTNARVTQNSTGTINYDGTNVTNSTVTGNRDNDTIVGAAGNDSFTGGSGADTIVGAAGNDTLTAGEGADTVDGGTGNDSIDLAESTQAADIARFTNDSKALATAGTGLGDDTGVDSLTGFDTTVDTLVITATGVINYTHATSSSFGTGSTGGAAYTTGAANEFSSGTLLLEFGSAAGTFTIADGIDMAINVSGQNASGVAATTANQEAAIEARMQYNLTGTAAANVITGGALADTISGGDDADTITGGAGADSLTGGSGADRFVYTTVTDSNESGGIDRITDLVLNGSSGDLLDFTLTGTLTVATANLGAAKSPADTVAEITALFNSTNGTNAVTFAGSSNAKALLVTATDGTLLIVDVNGDGAFTAADVVIDVTGVTATSFGTGNFI